MTLRSSFLKYVYLVFVFIVMALLCGSSEAFFITGVPEKIKFSPDSSKIAFIWSEKLALPWVDSPILSRDIFVYWCNVTDINITNSLKVDTIGKEYYGFINIPLNLKFSPDSNCLAVFTPNYLSVIDLQSKTMSRLSNDGEIVTSFQWVDNKQIGYCIHAVNKANGPSSERVFWLQNVTNGQKTRSKIYQEPTGITKKPLHRWPLEDWSPQGRYVIFFRKLYCDDSRFALLDFKEKIVKLSFGKPESYPVEGEFHCNNGVSWKSDESEVFCLAGVVGKGDNQQAYLIHANTGQIFDCSKDFSKTFTDTNTAPSLLGDWTPDGKYILANDYLGLGCCLIQPKPWKIVALQEKLATHLELDEKYKPHIFRLPIQGWIGINAIGLLQKYAADEAPKFAVDYEGQKIIPLFDNPGWWDCSPDGKFAAVVWYNKKLTLHKLAINK